MNSSSVQGVDYEAVRRENAAKRVSSTMMQRPLRVTDIMRRAEQYFGDREVISRLGPGQIERSTYAELGEKARRLAGALQGMDVMPGARVGTLMWNHASHLVCYYAAPAAGTVLHTLNPRLSAEELAYIVADAGDDVMIVDEDLLPLWREVETHVSVRHVIVNGSPEAAHDSSLMELAARSAPVEWPDGPFDENQAAAICYTSGTTGRPKGVVYSHRSITLHALAVVQPDSFGLSGRSTAFTLTPMFHVNGWGMPYAATMVGARHVLPGPRASAQEVLDLMESEQVSIAFGVPTIWNGVIGALEAEPSRWQLRHGLFLAVGGAMPPADMLRRFDRFGLYVQTGWGMTETSPIASQTCPSPGYEELDYEAQIELRMTNGLPLPLVDMRIADDECRAQPWDGEARGELQVRGPWITKAYIGHPEPKPAATEDGWLQTGDISVMRPDGYMKIVDRLKDVIKSGGEWISSVDMESALLDIDAVVEAAVIGIRDERWGERPLAIIVAQPGRELEPESVKAALGKRFPKWMIPERIEVVEELPRTGLGKLNKVALRQAYSSA